MTQDGRIETNTRVRELFQVGAGAPLLLLLACAGDGEPATEPDAGILASLPYRAEVLPQLDPFTSADRCTMPGGINDSGVVAGSLCSMEGYIWSPETGAVLLTEEFAAQMSQATVEDINNSGDVVGHYLPRDTTDGRMHTYRLTSDGELSMLPAPPPGTESIIGDINDAGLVVGASEVAQTESGIYVLTAVYWEDGEVHEIGSLGGPVAIAAAINESGTVVGYSSKEENFRTFPFRWTEAAGVEALPVLHENSEGSASGVSDSGLIVGTATASDGADGRAVVWDADGVHALPGIYANAYSSAVAVNDDEIILGTERVPPQHVPQARIWIDREVYALQELTSDLPAELTLGVPVAINRRGEILVNASYTAEGEHATETFSVVLRPTASALDSDARIVSHYRDRP